MKQKSFYIETYGCPSNKADSLIIAKKLKENGYNETNNFKDAQFIIINTCAVKQQTENKIKTRLKFLNNQYKNEKSKHIIVAGCLPHIDSNYIDVVKKIVPNFSAIINLDNFEELPDIFNKILAGEKNIIVPKTHVIDKSKFLINYPKGKITGILPISEGCLGSCTYCCVKNARGSLKCYNPENIIKNAEFQLKQGIKQIYLTSQDCSIYQYNNTSLSDLVHKINNLDYNFFLRIGMLNPKFIVDSFEQLKNIYQINKVYQFLHIPIQSGSDDVLKRMNRPYEISEIYGSLESLRKLFPSITISTDIITGFPGETEVDFNKTIELIEWLKPEIMNISKFTPRPGTKAKNMEQLNSQVIKQRSIQLSELFRKSLQNINKSWLGWEGKVLVLHEGKEVNQTFGRNYAYKNVFIQNYEGKYGEFINCKIIKVNGFNLYAQIS
jgi:MiaB-like tRNA modifying enzyme